MLHAILHGVFVFGIVVTLACLAIREIKALFPDETSALLLRIKNRKGIKQKMTA